MYENKYHSKDISKHSFLITGGAGFIGSNIVEYLLKYGAGKVRVLDNLTNGYYDNIKEFEGRSDFEFIKGDIRDYETCVAAVNGMDYVSHQAALGSVPRSINDPITSNAVNISGFLNMIHAVKENGNVKRMVYAASSSSYGDSKDLPKVEGNEGRPLSPYAITKWVDELYAENYSSVFNLHTIGLRYFNVFGPKQSPDNPYAAVIPLFMRSAAQGESPTINGDGETSRDFTFVENAVQANIKAMLDTEELAKHEVTNIAFGQRTTLNELWKAIQDAAGKKIEATYGPERAGDVRHSLADVSKAKSVFGYDPKFDILEGLKITYKDFAKNGK